jgi:hypothetical protein
MKKILLSSITLLILASGCMDMFGKRIRGNGNIQTETKNVSSFTGVDVSGAIDISVQQDASQSVKVEADENILPYIEIHNENGVLKIHNRSGVNLKPSRGIRVYVTGPDFRLFEASGACKIYSENQINSNDKIDIALSGASDVRMDLRSPRVDADLAGAGTVELRGATRDFSVSGSGSTNVKCYDLLAENVKVHITGAGDAHVFASVNLDVRVTGAGDVRYKGNATVTQHISGAGSVKKVE